MTRLAAMLCLFGALRWAKQTGTATRWSDRDWVAFVAVLSPREIAVVALKIREMEEWRIAEWLGSRSGGPVTRGQASNLWRSALRKLAAHGAP